ncbi:vps9 domain protein [Teratosphaeria destructans]|uniref:Vps9 domain protein n=1 Tax=Teratosphaeria destructans TaxID=418781 RepID=A0A9W7SMB4_9PEZI|nr:vps9 domain protein [Teratosphaeria destructans]
MGPQVSQTYHLSTSAYLTLQSLPLLLTPTLLVSMLAPDGPRPPTDLETYLSRSLALLLLSTAALHLLLSGLLPLTPDAAPENPHAFPALVTTTAYHALSAFYIYTRIATAGPGGAGVACYAGVVFSGALFALGVWTMLFAGEAGRVSRRTGNFPFVNVESARMRKREVRERESEERGWGKRRGVASGVGSRE